MDSKQNNEYKPQLTTIPEKRKMYEPVKIEPDLITEKQHNFFKIVTDNKEVAKAIVTLSNCLHGFKLELGTFKNSWMKFSELWTIDRGNFIKEMEEKKPSLREYEEVLDKYKSIK